MYVSMPSHGQHSFLLYPLKCPCFMRIIDPIFASNSQNILKKAFFRGFTCMFTVCSYLSIRLVFTMPSASKSIISYFSQTSYKNLALFLRNPEIFQDHISTPNLPDSPVDQPGKRRMPLSRFIPVICSQSSLSSVFSLYLLDSIPILCKTSAASLS